MTTKESPIEPIPFDEHVKILMEEQGLTESTAKWQAWSSGPRYRNKEKTNEV